MYLAVDFGGTKTLIALFNDKGEIIKRHKFETKGTYHEYVNALAQEVKHICQDVDEEPQVIAMAVPAPINYGEGTIRLARKMGDGWGDETMAEDLKNLTGTFVVIENDGNIAALGEAINGPGKDSSRVLYVTLSTGIGTGYVEDKRIDRSLKRSEGGFMMMQDTDGEWKPWEHIASGRAFTIKYGKLGSEVNDLDIWKEYAHMLAPGFINLMAIVQPEVIVVGGGMGAHLHKFQEYLMPAIENLRQPPVSPTTIVGARIPDDAVIYGCYELAKQQ